MKVAINGCYGGFGLSFEAVKRLVQMGSELIEAGSRNAWTKVGGSKFTEDIGDGFFGHEWYSGIIAKGKKAYSLKYLRGEEWRTHPDLIKVIEELGEKANGKFAQLRIVEIPDGIDWYIDEYDGIESVHEDHGSWS